MNRKTETQKTWEKVAELFESKFMDLSIYNNAYDELLVQLAKSNVSVLELGCGRGNISKYLLNNHKHLKLLGIDYASNMIELAKKNNPEAEFRCMDIININQLNQEFNAIVCGFCIPYLSVEECHDLFYNSTNLLSKSGLLFLSFVEGNYQDSRYISGGTGDRTFFYYYKKDDLKEDLEKQNFIVKTIIETDYEKANGLIEKHISIIASKN